MLRSNNAYYALFFGCGIAGKHFSNQGTMHRRAEPVPQCGENGFGWHIAAVSAVF